MALIPEHHARDLPFCLAGTDAPKGLSPRQPLADHHAATAGADDRGGMGARRDGPRIKQPPPRSSALLRHASGMAPTTAAAVRADLLTALSHA